MAQDPDEFYKKFKPDFVWANLSNPRWPAEIQRALDSERRGEYVSATADFNGWTALHYAVASESKWTAKLIAAGSDLKAKSTHDFYYGVDDLIPKGSTPEDVAVICDTEEAFKRALASVESTDSSSAASTINLTIKTLDKKEFQVEIEPSKTVADLKAAVQAASPAQDLPADRQTLVLTGKVLDDSDALSSYNFTPGSFIVCMVKKQPKRACAPTAVVASAREIPSSQEASGSSQKRQRGD